MTTPTVRYVIAADDKTRSAIASINKNFQSMEKGVKGTLKGLNLALGVFAGVQLKQAFKAVLNATAESEQGAKSFGKALTEVRDAAKDLLAAKSGLPEATKAMQDLRDTLKDPGIVAAADALTSALIRGFAGASKKLAEFAGGLRNLGVRGGLFDPIGKGEQIEAIDGKIERLRAQRSVEQNGIDFSGENSPIAKQARINIAAIDAEIAALERRQQLLIEYNGSTGPGRRGAVGGTGIGSGVNAAIAAREQAKRDAAAARRATGTTVAEVQRDILGDLDQETRREIEQTMDEINRESQRGLDELEGRWDKWKEGQKKTLAEASVFADQAARNMQDAFADFLFDPFENGIKGMLKGFVDILRRMVAEAAAAKVFEALGFGKSGGGGGGLLGKILGGIFGKPGNSGAKLPGFANGGSFMVGGSGGPDSQLVAFMGSPNERVTVTKPGQGGRMGGNVTIHYNIDARGATQELVTQLPGILRRQSEQTKAEIARMIRGGAFA